MFWAVLISFFVLIVDNVNFISNMLRFPIMKYCAIICCHNPILQCLTTDWCINDQWLGRWSKIKALLCAPISGLCGSFMAGSLQCSSQHAPPRSVLKSLKTGIWGEITYSCGYLRCVCMNTHMYTHFTPQRVKIDIYSINSEYYTFYTSIATSTLGK